MLPNPNIFGSDSLPTLNPLHKLKLKVDKKLPAGGLNSGGYGQSHVLMALTKNLTPGNFSSALSKLSTPQTSIKVSMYISKMA